MRTIVALVVRTALITVLASLTQGQTFNVVYAFQGPPADGANPFAGLVRDAEGNLYGTTETGGSGKPCGGCGAVFKLDRTGSVTWLYDFTGGADGEFPQGGVIRDQAGDLYGTTRQTPTGQGTVFKLTTTGSLTVLHRFTGGADGGAPLALPIRDQVGNLYGTANFGGDLSCNGGGGCGVVYRVTPSGKETVLYRFKGKHDGAFPTASLTRDRSGDLYGTVPTGGDTNCNPPYGCGIVFKLNRKGQEIVLHRFHGTGGDGSFPQAGLLLDASGNLYGTTSEGGAHGGGTVFKIDYAGRQTVLHSFNGYDGSYSVANLIMDKSGNLYGSTEYGGMGYGTVFKLDPSGKETVLHTFEYSTDGGAPLAPLIFEKGSLYGTTSNWGPSLCNQYGCGTVFKITP
jgi:uncharacterized repeat protein (TIGR03803 family)